MSIVKKYSPLIKASFGKPGDWMFRPHNPAVSGKKVITKM